MTKVHVIIIILSSFIIVASSTYIIGNVIVNKKATANNTSTQASPDYSSSSSSTTIAAQASFTEQTNNDFSSASYAKDGPGGANLEDEELKDEQKGNGNDDGSDGQKDGNGRSGKGAESSADGGGGGGSTKAKLENSILDDILIYGQPVSTLDFYSVLDLLKSNEMDMFKQMKENGSIKSSPAFLEEFHLLDNCNAYLNNSDSIQIDVNGGTVFFLSPANMYFTGAISNEVITIPSSAMSLEGYNTDNDIYSATVSDSGRVTIVFKKGFNNK